MTKSLCLVTYTYPPSRSVGAIRTGSIAKWLARRGWRVHVFAAAGASSDETCTASHSDGIDVTRVPVRYGMLLGGGAKLWSTTLLGRSVRKLLQALVRAAGSDLALGWAGPLERALSLRRPEAPEVVYVSGGPFVAFCPAAHYATRNGLSLVLEYRDLWHDHPHRRAYQFSWSRKAEKRMAEASSMIVAVTEGIADALCARYRVRAKLRVVTNGYDEDDLPIRQSPAAATDSIVYAGAFYPPKRSVGPLFQSLRLLRESLQSDGLNWSFDYYGSSDQHVSAEASRYAVEDAVKLHGYRPRAEVLRALAKAKCTLVVTSVLPSQGPQDDGILTGKLFELMGLGVPTIVLAPRTSEIHKLARDYRGLFVFAAHETEAIAQKLKELISEPARSFAPCPKYAWRALSERLDEELSVLIGR